MAPADLAVRTATESDLAFVSRDGHIPTSIVRRKLDDGDVAVALRGGDPVGYLRLEWLWSKLPYIELIWVREAQL